MYGIVLQFMYIVLLKYIFTVVSAEHMYNFTLVQHWKYGSAVAQL